MPPLYHSMKPGVVTSTKYKPIKRSIRGVDSGASQESQETAKQRRPPEGNVAASACSAGRREIPGAQRNQHRGQEALGALFFSM